MKQKHYSKLFSQLAYSAPLCIALSIPAQARAPKPIHLIPEGTVPEYVSKHYDAIIKDTTPDFSGYRIQTSVRNTSLPVPDNEFLKDLALATPKKAEKIARNCGPSLCANRYRELNQRDRTTASILVLESLFRKGLNKKDLKTYSQFVSTYKPEKAFSDRDQVLMREAVAGIISHPAFIAIQKDLVPITKISTENAEAQYYLRLNFMQAVSDEIRKAYGFAPIPVVLDIFPGKLSHLSGLKFGEKISDQEENNSVIDVNYISAVADHIFVMMALVAHETKHSIDANLMDALVAGKMSPDDINASHAAVLLLNNAAYILPCESDKSETPECKEQFKTYAHQYTERTATDYESNFIKSAKSIIAAGTPAAGATRSTALIPKPIS
jgi:hypothetical protein